MCCFFVFYFFTDIFGRYVLMSYCFLYLQISTMSFPNPNPNDNRGDKLSDDHGDAYIPSDNMDDLFSEYPLTQGGVFNALFCFFL